MRGNTPPRVTMKDVAHRADVTIGTVSHVINRTAGVSPKTDERVRQAIKELEYIPNSVARNMRLKRNHQVGLLIPNLTNNFYFGIVSSFVDQADQDGYTVLILGYEYSLEREKKALKTLYENNVGTIVIANGAGDEKYLQKYLNRGINIILADRHTGLKDVSYVEFENTKVIDDAVKMLKGKHYKSIGFLSEPLTISNIADRFEGYKKALVNHGYNFCGDYVYISKRLCMDNTQNGYLFMKELLGQKKKEELPEAFLISSDLQAIGTQRAIIEQGYTVPGDFGIIGCDNLEISGYVQPGLTTINQDGKLLGEELWKMAKMRTEGKDVRNIALEQQLIIRGSC